MAALVKSIFVFGVLFFLPSLGQGASDSEKACVNNQLGGQLTEWALSGSNRHTAAALLSHLAPGSLANGKSVFLPIFGLQRALTMVRLGIKGKSAEEMDRALGIPDASFADALDGYPQQLRDLKGLASTAIDLRTSADVWLNDRFQLSESYQTKLRTYFQTKATPLSFSSPDALNTINGAVSQTTQGKIPSILKNISSSDVLYLTVANYIKAAWAQNFDITLTQEEPFTLPNGTRVAVPMMHRKANLAWIRTGEYVGVSLPLKGDKLTLDLVLPNEVDAFLKGLDLSKLNTLIASFEAAFQHPHEAYLALPRLDLDFEADLIPTLQAMGMHTPFGSGAGPDFAELALQNGNAVSDLFISLVKTHAKLKLDEEGVEVADASAVGVAKFAAIALPTFEFNRPFLIFLRHRGGMILNAGVVANPKAP